MAIRKIGIASRTYRHVNRYRRILTGLIRYEQGSGQFLRAAPSAGARYPT